MSVVLAIARREWLEQWRQPAMLVAIGALFAIIGLLVALAASMLDHLAHNPALVADAARWFPGGTASPEAWLAETVGAVIGIANWLIFTQFLGTVAVLAGHAVLHDRQCGTLPFLLLAPVRRAELLLGKVVGAMGAPLVMYLALSGAALLYVSRLEVAGAWLDRLPPSPAWLVAFLLGGPLWALFVATLCAIVSSLTRDVRTAQQLVWFVMFFATFACGFLLAMLLPMGALTQLAVAGLGLVATAGAVLVGSGVISRDLGR